MVMAVKSSEQVVAENAQPATANPWAPNQPTFVFLVSTLLLLPTHLPVSSISISLNIDDDDVIELPRFIIVGSDCICIFY
jgi:hypothetical protein